MFFFGIILATFPSWMPVFFLRLFDFVRGKKGVSHSSVPHSPNDPVYPLWLLRGRWGGHCGCRPLMWHSLNDCWTGVRLSGILSETLHYSIDSTFFFRLSFCRCSSAESGRASQQYGRAALWHGSSWPARRGHLGSLVPRKCRDTHFQVGPSINRVLVCIRVPLEALDMLVLSVAMSWLEDSVSKWTVGLASSDWHVKFTCDQEWSTERLGCLLFVDKSRQIWLLCVLQYNTFSRIFLR